VVIVPSVDVRAGRVVFRGGVGAEVRPHELARRFVAEGAEELHLVDLDGADHGRFANREHLAEIARESGVPCRLAGGIADVALAEQAIGRDGFAGVLFSAAVFGDLALLPRIAALGRGAIVEIEVRAGVLAPRGGPGELARRAAAIDLGTNSIRLLVVRASDGEDDLVELARDMVITRLGQGVDATGRLNPAALRRTIDVLERFCRRSRALGAERVHLAATSAVRDASNRDELAAAVQLFTGEPMEVITGEREAQLSFQGATRGLRAPRPFLVLDIGGGSTEFVLGDDSNGPRAAVSMQIGSVRLTERLVHTDPPSYRDLEAVDRAVASALGEVEDRLSVHDARTLVAVAGTSTTVQAIALALPSYDPEQLHRTWLARHDAERVFRLLADMTTAERRAIPVMAPGREDVIPAGAAILVAVMQRWGFAQALVSETDILDGLAFAVMEELRQGD